jgi:hypothetical protein
VLTGEETQQNCSRRETSGGAMCTLLIPAARERAVSELALLSTLAATFALARARPGDHRTFCFQESPLRNCGAVLATVATVAGVRHTNKVQFFRYSVLLSSNSIINFDVSWETNNIIIYFAGKRPGKSNKLVFVIVRPYSNFLE